MVTLASHAALPFFSQSFLTLAFNHFCQAVSGIAHAEYKVTPEGRVCLMEIAARSPGDMILALYQLTTGQCLEHEIIKIALGEKAEYPKPTRFARQVYLSYVSGVLEDVVINGFDVSPRFIKEGMWRKPLQSGGLDAPPTVEEILIEFSRGSELPSAVSESRNRLGYFLIDAADIKALNALENAVRKGIEIKVTPVTGSTV